MDRPRPNPIRCGGGFRRGLSFWIRDPDIAGGSGFGGLVTSAGAPGQGISGDHGHNQGVQVECRHHWSQQPVEQSRPWCTDLVRRHTMSRWSRLRFAAHGPLAREECRIRGRSRKPEHLCASHRQSPSSSMAWVLGGRSSHSPAIKSTQGGPCHSRHGSTHHANKPRTQ